MIKRTIYLGSPLDLNIQLEQLIITNRETGEVNKIPVEDVGFVLFDHAELIYSHAVVQKLLDNNVAVVYCDEKRHPAGLLMPLCTHTIQSERFRHQIEAGKPLKKQLWQQTIQAKLRNQALFLKQLDKPYKPVIRWIGEVKSADAGGHEARGARHYWKHLFNPLPFYRDRYGPPPNNLLNYGYAILRASVARALSGSGLLPTLGIHHHNRYNAYCLADDIMEPYRPFVDRVVHQMVTEELACRGKENGLSSDITKAQKARLLSVLTHDAVYDNGTSPLMAGISRTTASLAACFAGDERDIIYPTLPK